MSASTAQAAQGSELTCSALLCGTGDYDWILVLRLDPVTYNHNEGSHNIDSTRGRQFLILPDAVTQMSTAFLSSASTAY